MVKRVLIIIDMQNDFIDENVLGNKETAAVVPKVVEKIKSEIWHNIFLTMDTHRDDYLETQEGKNLPVRHCVEYTHGWQIVDEIRRSVPIVSTHYFKNTFGSLSLCEDIRRDVENGLIDEIVLVGVCTDICVISNAMLLKAFCPEIPIFVDARCCAGTSPESHKRALEAMKMCQINVIEKEN